MKNTIGNSVALTIFGESHGEAVGVVIDGLASGISVNEELIKQELSKRRPSSSIDTARIEPDEFKILSGVFNGKTTGTPITIVIENKDKRSGDYESMHGLARPSHADYTAHVKYGGFEDYRGGGHFSGRVTAGIVAAGAIFKTVLNSLGIDVASHIIKCADVCDREFENIEEDIIILKNKNFPVFSSEIEEQMTAKIMQAKNNQDSVGGVVQTAIIGLPAGVGEPWFDSFEGVLSHALFSIGGIKGIEFGLGFKIASMNASTCNDLFVIDGNKVKTTTNNNGGINGGITNGMPVIFNCAVKPTPSISKPQTTVNFLSNENSELVIKGRHDPAIIRRICPVIDAITAFVVCDMLAVRYGTNVLSGKGNLL